MYVPITDLNFPLPTRDGFFGTSTRSKKKGVQENGEKKIVSSWSISALFLSKCNRQPRQVLREPMAY